MADHQAHEAFMRIALEEAATSAAEGNQGVGSVIVRDGEIIARGRNLENTTHDPTAHAESVAIRNYASSLADSAASQSWDEYFGEPPVLTGTTLYSTYEPCPMCCGAVLAAGISTIVLGGRPDRGTGRWGGYTVERLLQLAGRDGVVGLITGVLPDECSRARNT